ncbi:phospholipase D-like domain-containing protein [Gracilimonas mengyeensis]|uniref:Cardiolipin synthase n=1 Tax=Gracilimonas mengyeensis TaxID=1302730 RepID=A0A521FCV7_9BACT|nr:phospholipase D-like domain-containing protein [Gracilimonas mengyeensis]SMO93864.1 cardiolipin synthase [Gracilimonas mengyeensis]
MSDSTSYYQGLLEQSLGIPFSFGNKIEVLKNGDQIFPSMLEAIRNAEERIEFLTFVYWKGNIAREFARALARKAEEGVEVFVILDSFGAAKMPSELYKMMENSGVQLQWFRPMPQWKIWKVDNRTHRKVLICDGEVAFTGGVGIASEWEGDARNEEEWRDTHFRIEGPAVFGLQAAFMENWVEGADHLEFDHTIKGTPAPGKETAVQVIRTSASVRWSDIVMLYQALIKMAKENIRITTAYFNPNEVMIGLLKQAAARGVDVQIMVPGEKIDKQIARIAGDESFEDLLESDVKLWYYQKTMLHSKVITVDDRLSCVGSANFNHRSMLKDDEVNVVILDEEVTKKLNKHFEDDLAECEKIDETNWKKRGVLKKATEKVTRIFSRQI